MDWPVRPVPKLGAQSRRMTQNLSSPRARYRKGCAMAAHDRLPPELRRWLIHAALPWSAKSALRLWTSTLRKTNCPTAALAALTTAEAQTLARERW